MIYFSSSSRQQSNFFGHLLVILVSHNPNTYKYLMPAIAFKGNRIDTIKNYILHLEQYLVSKLHCKCIVCKTWLVCSHFFCSLFHSLPSAFTCRAKCYCFNSKTVIKGVEQKYQLCCGKIGNLSIDVLTPQNNCNDDTWPRPIDLYPIVKYRFK